MAKGHRDRLTPTLFAANDLLLSLLACLLVAAFLIAAKKPQDPTKETDKPAGNISVNDFWQNNIDADVDLWLRQPDGEVVSFHHKSGSACSLLRDDLGGVNDITTLNFENTYCRGGMPGEYAVNAQLYRNPSGVSIDVQAELRIQRDLNQGSPVTFNAHVTLDHVGDEATLFRFSIDEDGDLVPGSVHSQFMPLAKEEK